MPWSSQRGTSLSEVLVALVLLSATAAWGLQATAHAERSLGELRRREAALHRAERALDDLAAMPCESLSVVRTSVEPRWRVFAGRDHDGLAFSDDVVLTGTALDTLRLHRGGWCD
jgi:type II secretory pathway component PulJ